MSLAHPEINRRWDLPLVPQHKPRTSDALNDFPRLYMLVALRHDGWYLLTELFKLLMHAMPQMS